MALIVEECEVVEINYPPTIGGFVLPRLFYEVLPLIYSLCGVLAVIRLDSALGRISGALLLSAAVAIYTLRRVYRRDGL